MIKLNLKNDYIDAGNDLHSLCRRKIKQIKGVIFHPRWYKFIFSRLKCLANGVIFNAILIIYSRLKLIILMAKLNFY